MKLHRHFTRYCLELCQDFNIDHCIFIYFMRNPFLGNFACVASFSGNSSFRNIDLAEVAEAITLFHGDEHVSLFNMQADDPVNKYMSERFHFKAKTMTALPVNYGGIQIGTLIAALENHGFLPMDNHLLTFKKIVEGMTVYMDDLLVGEEEPAYIHLKSELKKVWEERIDKNQIQTEDLIKALGVVVDVRKLFFEVNADGVHYWHISEVDKHGDLLVNMTQSVPVRQKQLSDDAGYENAGFNLNVPVTVKGELIGNIRISTFIGFNLYMVNVKRVLERASMEIVRLLPGENAKKI